MTTERTCPECGQTGKGDTCYHFDAAGRRKVPTVADPSISTNAEEIACAFHEAYERLAPQFGYRTRESSAKPWDEVPENNRRLMVATVREVLESGELVSADDWPRLAYLRAERDELRDSYNRMLEDALKVRRERDDLRADLAEAKIGRQCQTERGDRLKAKLESAATSCEWCSESTEEINNAYTQLDELCAEREQLRAEKERLMEELNTSQLETIEFQKMRDALLDAIAEHRADPFNGKLLDALHAKAEAVKRGET